MSEQTAQSISLVVPVYNGGENIHATIEHLLRQSLAPEEIIVVNDGSTDQTANILKRFGSRIKVLSKSNGGPASARNAGVLAATGSLIAFTDSDCFPNEDWLENLVQGFFSAEVVGVGGTVHSAVPGLMAEYIDLRHSMNPEQLPDGSIFRLVTANACFRREILVKANLFDERFRKPGGEDTELSVRLTSMGYKLAFVKTAVVQHRHRQTIRDYLRTVANHGEGQYIVDTLWPKQVSKENRPKQIVRSGVGARTMIRFYRSYRQQRHRPLKALLFSLLDHLQFLARRWGYRRGKQTVFSSLQNI